MRCLIPARPNRLVQVKCPSKLLLPSFCFQTSLFLSEAAPAASASTPRRQQGRQQKKDRIAEWHVWKRLDDAHEAEKVALASFINGVARLEELLLKSSVNLSVSPRAAEKEDTPGSTTSRAWAAPSQDITIRRSVDSGFSLPKNLSQGLVEDMVRRFLFGDAVLNAECFARLLEEAGAILAVEPNIKKIDLAAVGTVVSVVGDLHGSIKDLHQVLETVGMPRDDHHLIFNGDFVDRGAHGVEVVATLCALKILWPKRVHLHRGHHEDRALGRAYGFYDEVLGKYADPSMYDRVMSTFSHLPLCSVIDKTAFVVHGGLQSLGMTLGQIEEIDRHAYETMMIPKGDDGIRSEQPAGLLCLRDLMWSDPRRNLEGSEVVANAIRGAGCFYGPDVVREWLKKHGLKYLVRSHECVRLGYDILDCGEGIELYTVFSSSNYGGCGNKAAVLRLRLAQKPEVIVFDAKVPLDLYKENQQKLRELVCKRKRLLKQAFREHAGASHTVDVDSWTSIMAKHLKIDIDFTRMLGPGEAESGHINYREFLSRYTVEMSIREGSTLIGLRGVESSEAEALFKHFEEFKAVFRLLDRDASGSLSKEEFKKGCELMNDHLPEESSLEWVRMFEILDLNGDGLIDLEEFCRALVLELQPD